MSVQALYGQLEELYRELEVALQERPDVNSCGSCFACCRSQGRVAHNVSELELRYLEQHAGPQPAFRAYLTAREDQTCPHYEAGRGCQVYAYRPYSCRVFGHFRETGTALPAGCVYHESCETYPARELTKVVPGAARLKRLQLELRMATGSGSTGAARKVPARLSRDAFDQALNKATLGDAAGAETALQAALAEYGETAYALYNAGLIYAILAQPERSLAAFLRCCEALPDRADAFYYAATQAMLLGRSSQARELLEVARRLAPTHEATLGLLGSLYRLEGLLEEARDCLLNLTTPLDRFHLGEVWVGLGEPDRARPCFEEAGHHAPLSELSRQALARL